MTVVINRRKSSVNETVYIGRGSIWGNPYAIGIDGNREEVIQKYAYHLYSELRRNDITLEQLKLLSGEVLGCYCKPTLCHGDVLVEASKWALTVDSFDPNAFPEWLYDNRWNQE